MLETGMLLRGVKEERGASHDGPPSYLPTSLGAPKEKGRLGRGSQPKRVRLYTSATIYMHVYPIFLRL